MKSSIYIIFLGLSSVFQSWAQGHQFAPITPLVNININPAAKGNYPTAESLLKQMKLDSCINCTFQKMAGGRKDFLIFPLEIFTYQNYYLNHLPLSSPFKQRMLSKFPIKRFFLSKSNPNRAYMLLKGSRLKGLLNKGVKTFDSWDWTSGFSLGADITPQIVSNPQTGLVANDFCVDDKNENRIFLAIGDDLDGALSKVNGVLFSSNAGNTWTPMSEGLDNKPVLDLIYWEGSDDVIFANTKDGIYMWNKEGGLWEKYLK